MDTAALASSMNRRRPLIFLLLILLVPTEGCEKKKEIREEARKEEKIAREEARKEQKVPIGIVTTTNYCKGRMTSADVEV